MYNNFEELLKYCTANACPISEAVMRNEERLTGCTRDEIMNNLRDMYSVMSAEAEKALDKPLSAGDTVSARGFGKFQLSEVGGVTKKGRTAIVVKRYI